MKKSLVLIRNVVRRMGFMNIIVREKKDGGEGRQMSIFQV
jgi:hypothetical protein